MAGLASGLGHFALWDHWKAWQAQHRAALAVTAEDIRRVASKYLVESALTVGWSLPRPGSPPSVVLLPFGVDNETPRPPTPVASAPTWNLVIPQAAPRLVNFRPRRSRLENGLRILSERRPGCGTVSLDLYCDAGVLREQKSGVANLTGRLREEGTEHHSAEELAGLVEDVGGQLEVHATGVSLRVRAEDLPMAVEVLADLTLRPSFPSEAFEWTKKRISAEIHADRDDPSYRANLIFSHLIYGDHPYGRDPRGKRREVKALTLEDVRTHHHRFFVPDHAHLVVVGDYDSNRLRGLLRKHLNRWKSIGSDLGALPRPTRSTRPRIRRVSSPGEQVHVLLGHLGIARNHPDYHALTVLDYILGTGPGFTDRLSRVLRDEMGLAYSVSGSIAESADLVPGALRLYVGTS
ncbi:MAG TPA: pitrilysin family protein, partial [Isosphaeraceae bacterium]|nr:pitrilysin family protein [Isosphaeraceae bacterium]